MQGEQELVLVQELRSLVARDMGLHSQAEDLSPARMHHFAEGGIHLACPAEVEAAARAQEGQVVLEEDGYSVP